MPTICFDVAVVGGGPAGVSAAIAIALTGARTALIARRVPYADNRTTALLGDYRRFPRGYEEAWPRCSDKAAALRAMRLVDDTGRLIRAPEVKFSSDEIGSRSSAIISQTANSMAALEDRAAEIADFVRFDDEADAIEPEEAVVAIGNQGRTIPVGTPLGTAPTVAIGMPRRCRDRCPTARAEPDGADLTEHRAIRGRTRMISTEFHTSQGPCVFVPAAGQRCSVVWVSSPKEG